MFTKCALYNGSPESPKEDNENYDTLKWSMMLKIKERSCEMLHGN